MLAVTAASGEIDAGAQPALRLRSAAAVEPESPQDPVLTVLRVAPGAVATLRARLAADGVREGVDGMAPAARLVIQDGGYSVDDCADLPGLGCPVRPLEPVPSRDQGWGIIQLDRALLFDGDASRLRLDDERDGFTASSDPPLRRELTTGATGPLKAVLVWTDPPSTSLAAVNLVNDLDLVVEGSDGTFLGNHLVEGISRPGGSADRLNNVEVVWLPEALPGEWTVEVRPHAIREAGQGFALVVLAPPAAPEIRHVRRRLAP
jgi:hypothetical protein